MIFFDIDGTLVDAHSAQSDAWASAFDSVVGRKVSLTDIDHHGATSYAMVTQLVEPHECAPDVFRQLFLAHTRALDEALGQGSLKPLPGVADTLAELEVAGVTLGVLTGNSPEAARVLLKGAGIDRYFKVMVCGNDTSERGELVARAVAVASQDRPITLVGDTPKDLKAAKDQHCRTVAVATGTYTPSELSQWNPDLLLANLRPPAASQILRLASES